MDLLDNIATELGFEFHLYIVRDQLFGSKQRNVRDFIKNKQSTWNDKKITDGKIDGNKLSNGAGQFDQEMPSSAHDHQHQQQQQNQQQYQHQQHDHQGQGYDGNADGKSNM